MTFLFNVIGFDFHFRFNIIKKKSCKLLNFDRSLLFSNSIYKEYNYIYINKSITSKSHLFSKHLTLENRYHFSLQNHQYIKAQSLKRRLIDY